jgi:hypothetical protein
MVGVTARVAVPPESVPVPSAVLPSLNVTVPVAAVGVTFAVRVAEDPIVAATADTVVVDEPCDTVRFIVPLDVA